VHPAAAAAITARLATCVFCTMEGEFAVPTSNVQQS
jgi:hypothetical protein